MKKIVLIMFLLNMFFSLFWECSSESKEGTSIPPVPEINEDARRNAAISFLTQAIDASPNSSENYYKRCLLFLENEKIPQALEDINNAISLKPNVGNYFQAKALVLSASGQTISALEAASKAEVLRTESPELYILLGDLYQQINQFDKAKAYLRKALQISPNNGETFFYQGEIAAKLADTTVAIGLYQQALSLKPSFLPVYLKLIQVHTNLKEYDIALLYSLEALKFYPKNANIYLQRGNTYQKSWKLDSAVMCYNRVIQLDTNLIQASFNTGIIYFKTRAYRLALPFFERTLKHNVKFPDAKYYVAQCLEYTGQYVQAEALYNQIIAENPQDYKAIGGITRTQRKEIYGDYVPNFDLKYDTTAFPKFEMPKRTTDTSALKPIQPKGIKN